MPCRSVAADEKLTAVLESGSGPSGGTPRGYFCQPWRGQAAARWDRRATRPNAVKDRNNNAKEDPASGAVAVVQLPGVSLLKASVPVNKFDVESLVKNP